jgi:hypothetical protein
LPDVSEPSPPGWYDDPYGAPGLLRWWDGRQWTQATEPAQGPSPEPLYGRQAPEPLYGQQPPPEPLYGRPTSESPYGRQPPRPGGRNALPWLLGGGGLIVIVVVVIVAVLAFGGGNGGGPAASSGSPTPAGSPASTAPGTRSAVTGTITDGKAGISYDRLGPPWENADAGWMTPGMFDAGEVSVVQEPFEQYASFNATSLSGVPRPAESAGYTSPQNLSGVGRRVTGRILHEHFAFDERQTTIFSGARTVDGHQAWLEKFRLDFTDAEAKNWKFSADTVAILVVDVGGGRLAELWVSVPDTFSGQGDVDQVLDSVKVS